MAEMVIKKVTKNNRAALKARYMECKRAIFAAYGIQWTAEDEIERLAAPDAFVKLGDLWWPCWKSGNCLNISPVYVSDGMTGKMEGVPSVSTDCRVNPICRKRAENPDCICHYCFAEKALNRFNELGEHEFINTLLLMNNIVPDDLLPIFGNVAFSRVESFGDVGNVTHAINYLNMVRVNPFIRFGWWSKNVPIVDRAINICGGKPSNMILIQSSLFVNREEKPMSENVDKVFTVFDPDFIREHNISINCGARCCVACRRCYGWSDEIYIREILK